MHIRSQLLSGSLPVFRTAPRTCQRAFTTSSPLCKRKGGDLGHHLPKHIVPRSKEVPAYPLGPSRLFKQSNKGLYGGAMIQFGNNVSPDSETKTRRHWTPNALNKSLYSASLRKRVKLRITANVLRTIDKVGGLDEYLLGQTERRVKELGPTGWQLRVTLMQTQAVKDRLRAQAEELGLDADALEKQITVADSSADPNTFLSNDRWTKRQRNELRRIAEDYMQRQFKYITTFNGVSTTKSKKYTTSMTEGMALAKREARLAEYYLRTKQEPTETDAKARAKREVVAEIHEQLAGEVTAEVGAEYEALAPYAQDPSQAANLVTVTFPALQSRRLKQLKTHVFKTKQARTPLKVTRKALNLLVREQIRAEAKLLKQLEEEKATETTLPGDAVLEVERPQQAKQLAA